MEFDIIPCAPPSERSTSMVMACKLYSYICVLMCYSVVKSQSINGRGLVADLLSLPVAVPGISKIIPCYIYTRNR